MSLPVTAILLTFALGAIAGIHVTRAAAAYIRERRRATLRLRSRQCRQITLWP